MPKASPMSTGYTPKVTVLAKTKTPSSSRMQMPTPVLLRWLENAASTLQFIRPCSGGCHRGWTAAGTALAAAGRLEDNRNSSCYDRDISTSSNWNSTSSSANSGWLEDSRNSSCYGRDISTNSCWLRTCRSNRQACSSKVIARCQSSIKDRALSTTIAQVSVTSSHTFKFLCFQRLQNIAASRWESVADKECNNEKIASMAEVDDANAPWVSCHKPAVEHTWTAKEHSKNTWDKSSWLESQLTHWVGNWTPLSNNRTRVGKQPRHIRQIRFLTFGGVLSFQMPVQYPSLWRWDKSTNSLTHSR